MNSSTTVNTGRARTGKYRCPKKSRIGNIVSLSSFASAEEIDVIITNRGISREMETSLEENDIRIITV
jgi:DeoR/GlpR family transcriptional regulator of sugar metabolism